MSEREAFEAWAFENGLQSHTDQSLDYPLGNVLWKCWQGRAAIEAQRVPDGWKLVPIEPTKAMLDASALDDQMNTGSIRAAWKDMVAAAPPVAQPAEPVTKEMWRDLAESQAELLRMQNGQAQLAERKPCNACSGTGRMPRDPDIDTDQECFVCAGTGIGD